MNRNTLGFTGAILFAAMLVAGIVASVMIGLNNSAKLDATAELLKPYGVTTSVQKTAQAYLAQPYNIRDRACGTQTSTFCGMLQPTTYDRLGAHDPLWVLYDGVNKLSQGKLDRSQRMALNQAEETLAMALRMHGVYQMVWNADPSPEGITARRYRATVALGLACMNVGEMGCRGALPGPVMEALRTMASLVAAYGTLPGDPAQVAFATSPHQKAVETMLASLSW